MVFISERASSRAPNHGDCVRLVFLGVRNVGMFPNASIKSSSLLGPIVSPIALTAIRHVLWFCWDG